MSSASARVRSPTDRRLQGRLSGCLTSSFGGLLADTIRVTIRYYKGCYEVLVGTSFFGGSLSDS